LKWSGILETPKHKEILNNMKVTAVNSSQMHNLLSHESVGFGADCLDEYSCRRRLTDVLHSKGAFCPHCGKPVSQDSIPQWQRWGRIKCSCGRWFTARTGTALSGSRLSGGQVMLLSLLLTLGQSNQTIARLTGVSTETVRCWRKGLTDA
jgi:transposase-like protein